MSARIFRVVVDAWPTPDGKPFTEQDAEFWVNTVDAWADGHTDANPAPDWLPDLSGYVYASTNYDRQGPTEPGAVVFDDCGDPILHVPSLTRRQFFARHAAKRRLDQLLEWGVTAHLESAPIGEWEPLT